MLNENVETKDESMTMKLSEGMTIRPALMNDVESVVSLLNRCSREEIGEEEYSVSEWAADWRMETFNLADDTRVVMNADHQIVAYADIFALEPYVKLYSILRVHPDARGQGIESTLMQWIDERCQSVAPKAPAGAKVVAEMITYEHVAYLRALYEQHGYSHKRDYLQMMIELNSPPPQPVWSDGIMVRSAIPGQDDRAIYDAYIDSFSDHWGFVVRPFETIMEIFRSPEEHFDPTVWFLAMDGPRVAGICLCSSYVPEDPQKAWVGTLGVVRDYRRRGIGLALLHHTFGEFYRRGYQRVGLGVDADSLTGATRLYEKAGMHVTRSLCSYQKVVRDGVDITTQVAL